MPRLVYNISSSIAHIYRAPIVIRPSLHRRARAAATFAAIALALPLSTTLAAQRATRPQPLAGLDAYIEDAMHDWGVPGLAIAIVKNDSVVFAKGYGVREVGKPDKVDTHTLFAIGSNTKAFTSALIGSLVDDGTMRWDAPVTTYLPWFQMYDPWVTRELTIRDALSHRSGLGRRGDLLWYGSAYSRDDVLHRIRHLAPNSSFRSQYGYSNIMVLAAGQAAAAAAGKTWDQLISERIFRPLHMTESNTSVATLAGLPDVATPHAIDKGVPTPIPWRNIDNIGPAGSINSSVTDMAQWLRLQLAGGTLNGTTIVKPATLEETHSPQTIIPSRPDSLFPSEHFTDYGFGWVLQDYRGRKLVWHNGGIDGMLSEVRLVPEEKLGIVILTNGEGHALNPALAYRIMDAYMGAPARDWSTIFLTRFKQAQAKEAAAEQAVIAARVPNTTPSLPLDKYTGTYSDTLYGDAHVTLEHGKLVLQYGPSFTGNLEHWNYDTFRVTWRDARQGSAFVTFTLDARGKTDGMDVQGITTFHAAPPAPASSPR